MTGATPRQGLAALLLLFGLVLPGLLYLVLLALLLVQREEALLLGAVVVGALALFGLVLGGLLAGPRLPFHLSARRVLLLWLGVLALGSLLLASRVPFLIALGMPPLHLASALLPAFLALALARGGRAQKEEAEVAVVETPQSPASQDAADGPEPPLLPEALELPEQLGSPEAQALTVSLSPPAALASLSPLESAAAGSPASQEPTESTGAPASAEAEDGHAAPTAPTPSPSTPSPAPRPTLTWATAGAGLAWGGCAATFLALVIESLLGLGILAFILVAWPQAQEIFSSLGESMAAGAQPDPEAQAALMLRLASEPVLVFAGWLLMGLLAPFAEELVKLLGPLWAQGRSASTGGPQSSRPASGGALRQQAWWRGVAVGTGFGVFEALFYSAMALAPVSWALAVALRACTTLVHGIFTGTAALGWHLARSEGRRGLGILGILAAFLGHALWNSLALGAVVAGLQAGGSNDGPPTGPLAGALAVGVVLTFYGLLAFFGVCSRRLARAA